MEVNNIIDVENFVVACNDMLSGKFLDLGKRLDKFLTIMTKSEDILNLLSSCLENFDEEIEFSKAFSVDKKTGAVKVAMPVEDEKRLALSVSIFNDIITDKLNANQFLETYFQDQKMTPMQNFLDKIIKPYRDTICKIFEVAPNVSPDDIERRSLQEKLTKQEEVEEEEKEQFPHIDDIMAGVVKTCNQILAILKFERRRTDVLDDVEFIVNSIIKECEKKDLMVINALVVGLNYCSKKFRNIRHLVVDLNGLIYDYYDYLASLSEPAQDQQNNLDEFDEE